MITTLIVDDELDMRTLVRLVLELKGDGFEVVAEAADGAEALDAWTGLNPPTMPDVVILDNRMPKLSGLEVAQKILEQHPNQKIVLYSAHLNDEVRAEAAELGITECLTKTEIRDLPEVLKKLSEQ